MLKAMFAEKAVISNPEQAFISAIHLQDIQDNEPTVQPFDGNAFSGSGANRQHAEMQMFQAALVNGGETGAPLVNVLSKLPGQFNTASGKKKDSVDNSYMSLILDQQAKSFNEFLNKELTTAKENLTETEESKQRFEDGTFDPLNYERDKEYIEERGLSEDEWSDMSLQSQKKWLDDTYVAELNEYNELESVAQEFARNPDKAKQQISGFANENGELSQDQMKAALADMRTQQAENTAQLLKMETQSHSSNGAASASTVTNKINGYDAGFF